MNWTTPLTALYTVEAKQIPENVDIDSILNFLNRKISL